MYITYLQDTFTLTRDAWIVASAGFARIPAPYAGVIDFNININGSYCIAAPTATANAGNNSYTGGTCSIKLVAGTYTISYVLYDSASPSMYYDLLNANLSIRYF